MLSHTILFSDSTATQIGHYYTILRKYFEEQLFICSNEQERKSLSLSGYPSSQSKKNLEEQAFKYCQVVKALRDSENISLPLSLLQKRVEIPSDYWVVQTLWDLYHSLPIPDAELHKTGNIIYNPLTRKFHQIVLEDPTLTLLVETIWNSDTGIIEGHDFSNCRILIKTQNNLVKTLRDPILHYGILWPDDAPTKTNKR